MRKILFAITLFSCLNASAIEPLHRSDHSQPTGIAPLYFGPNALPVPDMLNGQVSETLSAELATDYYAGKNGDQTVDIFTRVKIPLFTERVNLTLWMPVAEWFRTTPERLAESRVQSCDSLRGVAIGDVYISTDVQILKERKFIPSVAFRAMMKTASG